MKISANLAEEIVEDMKRRAEEQGISMTELLRQALATQKFLQEEQDRGTKLILQRAGENDRELVGTPNHYRTGRSRGR
ncbi:CopG family transcriptional regulator [Nocardioides sp. 1609]|uniref:CopG family transcriptional regulator n=1 Tax=Nocardioides sp. 1609 TaxID=2508327 RepID=UPI001431CF28|nr:CopG family transcriptional regulator [Nocardioides sp. 1609]